MNRIKATTLFALASLAMIGAASAQEHSVQATVPFNFTVAGKLLPSGAYTITSLSSGSIEIENRDSHLAVLSRTSYDSREAGNGGKLVFDKYGNQYFLKEVLCPYAGMTLNLPPSKQEKKAKTQEATIHQNSQVFVAAK
jgi:hypothetical protein